MPPGKGDYSICSVRAMISSCASGDSAGEEGRDNLLSRTTRSTIPIRALFGFQPAFHGSNNVVLNMPAFVLFKEGTQQDIHQLLLIGFILQRGPVSSAARLTARRRGSNRSAVYPPSQLPLLGRDGPFRKPGLAPSAQRSVRLTTIRRGHRCRAKRYVCGRLR